MVIDLLRVPLTCTGLAFASGSKGFLETGAIDSGVGGGVGGGG